jgi:hypothetical protein
MAQNKAADVERAGQDTNQQRQLRGVEKALAAEGLAAADEDQASSERDADGRRLWERDGRQQAKSQASDLEVTAEEHLPVKDPTGNSGNQLDLTG